MISKAEKKANSKVTFPLRLEVDFSKKISKAVYHTEAKSKHQYIMDAINEKIKRDLGE